jgi:hypothetical protein
MLRATVVGVALRGNQARTADEEQAARLSSGFTPATRSLRADKRTLLEQQKPSHRSVSDAAKIIRERSSGRRPKVVTEIKDFAAG